MAHELIPIPKHAPSTASGPPIFVSGTHRGGTAAQPALIELAKVSARPTPIVAFDPAPGRAEAYAAAARKQGVDVRPVTSRFEDAIVLEQERPLLHDLHVDRAETIVAAIEHGHDHAYAVSALLLLAAPGVGVLAYRVALAPGQERDYDLAATLFRGIAAVSGRQGSRAILAPGAPAHGRIEARMRDWYAEHLRKDVASLAGGQALPFAIEATDGRITMPVAVLSSRELDQDADRVANRLVNESPFALRANQPFHSVEIAESPEPTLRFRTGYVRRNHVVQVGRPLDLGRGRVEEMARLEVAAAQSRNRGFALAEAPTPETSTSIVRASRTPPDARRSTPSPAAALGVALAVAALGLATARNPVETTD